MQWLPLYYVLRIFHAAKFQLAPIIHGSSAVITSRRKRTYLTVESSTEELTPGKSNFLAM